jgi:catechol 2,3-dioxygenase-like lactoylglutathione lyase family enzyme
MFERVEMRVADLTPSRRFYATVLGALPLAPTRRDAGGHAVAWGDFALAQPRPGLPPTRGLHIGFAASSRAAVDAFWEAGVRAGSFALVAAGEPTRNAHLAVVAGAATVVGMHIDPGGNRVELVQPPPPARDAP